ncbi:hypothetical protein [Paeniglutamicibacter sp. Y32M11]|uniref:hypothetical protein n=1 Tax=Paeniglutamicibacter sp. Y32M11 TaxID=2853258 RepID=UPI001C5282CB|nr:hypothetical protein [Paeniglutamicibacter sp. Y32M11]QXQ10376.1 hypothetical protein KUF55_18505 [Paeniglutamicibacter sp. Y32M11]
MSPVESPVARPRFGHAEVWVESPLQLLSAIEAHGAGLLGTTSRIHPRGGTTTLDATLETLIAQAPAGVEFAHAARTPPTPGSVGARRWVTGDAYSGRVQRALLGPIAVKEVMIIDDGLATLGLIKALVSVDPTPLIRPRSASSPARKALGIASWYRLRSLARAGRLLVFTALPVDPVVARKFLALGGHLESHRFEWLSTQPVTERIAEPTVVVGSAMAADGLIRKGPYLEWLKSLTQDGPVAYFPHRRESQDFLDRLGDHELIAVRHHTIPIEMRLRNLRSGQVVRALPSTALPSLRLLLGSAGVRIIGKPIPAAWWQPSASPELRTHLSSSLELLTP